MLKNKNILITGGLGFVGSHLASALVKFNKVFILDNLFSGTKSNKIKGAQYKFDSTINIYNLYKNKSIDLIFHLGEYSRVEQSFEDIEKVYEFNTIPFYQVLKLALHHNAKLIYCGSSTKFAQYNKSNVASPYAWTKKNNTEFLKMFSAWYGLRYAIAYFYNVYGEGERAKGKYATVIAKFLYLRKKKSAFLPVTRPGTQKRNFTHIDDIVRGLILVGKKGKGDNYGIGANQSYTILQLTKMIGLPAKLTPPMAGNRMYGTLKTSKIKKLGWKQRYQLQNYIKEQLQE